MTQETNMTQFGLRCQRLARDPVFGKFLVATGKIFARRKEDIQTRRVMDKKPQDEYMRKLMSGGYEKAAPVVREFEDWCERENAHEERRLV